ncbi:MAG: OsmC family protein [Chloroflexota bacterium]
MTGTVRLDGEARWQARSGTGHTLIIDGPAEHGGENAGFRAMELMLLSLGGCLGGAMLHILKRMRQPVTGYEIGLEGSRDEEPPTVYRQITLRHTISGRGLDEAAVKRALALVEDKYCAAHSTLACTAKLVHEIHIVEA